MSWSLCVSRRAATVLGAALTVLVTSGLVGCGNKKEDGTVVKDAAPKCAKVAPLTKSKGKPTKVEVPSEPATKLVTEDLRPGTGAAAVKGKQLTVNYVGISCSTGQEFDTSWGKKGKDKDAPLKFVLGTGKVIKGWDKGLAGMKVGGERRLVIPGDLAYGQAGQPPSISSDDTLVFVVDLRAVDKAPPETTTTISPSTTAVPGASTTTLPPGSTTTSAAGSSTTTAPTGSTTTTAKP